MSLYLNLRYIGGYKRIVHVDNVVDNTGVEQTYVLI